MDKWFYFIEDVPGYSGILLDSSGYTHRPIGPQSLFSVHEKSAVSRISRNLPLHPSLDNNHNITYMPQSSNTLPQTTTQVPSSIHPVSTNPESNKHIPSNLSNVLKTRYSLHRSGGVDKTVKSNVVIVQRLDTPSSANTGGRTIKHRHSVASGTKPLILREYKGMTNGSERHSHRDYTTGVYYTAHNGSKAPDGITKDEPIPRRRRQYHKTELGECDPASHSSAHSAHVLQVLHTANPTLESHRNGSKKMRTDDIINSPVSNPHLPNPSVNSGTNTTKQYCKDRSLTTYKKVVNMDQMLNATFTCSQVSMGLMLTSGSKQNV